MHPDAIRITLCRCALGGALVLLVACGQTPQAAVPTALIAPTAAAPNLQATVDVLQTQVAAQPSPAPATAVPPPQPTAIPTATEQPTAEANPLLGVWTYSQSLLQGEPEPYGKGAPAERFEFFADKSIDITSTDQDVALANVPKHIKGTYALSADGTMVTITVGDRSQSFAFDGDRLVMTINVWSTIGPNATPDVEEIIYTHVT